MLLLYNHMYDNVLFQVKLKSWEKRLVDELSGSDVKQLLSKAEDWESQYLKALPKPGNMRLYTTQSRRIVTI